MATAPHTRRADGGTSLGTINPRRKQRAVEMAAPAEPSEQVGGACSQPAPSSHPSVVNRPQPSGKERAGASYPYPARSAECHRRRRQRAAFQVVWPGINAG